MGYASINLTRALVTLSISLGLSACASPPSTQPALSPLPGGGPTGSPPFSVASAAPSADPGTATQAPIVSAAPSATTTPGSPGETGILRGTVYDGETHQVPDGTRITASSLDASQPYDASSTTAGGNYVLNGVPLNTQISVSVTRPGWTTRTQVVVVRAYDPRLLNPNVLNFGGKVSGTDRRGISYFLSPYPEIESVTPTDDDRSQPRDAMRFTLTMSEPLDAENRRRLAAAFMIVPNNAEALAEDQPFTDAIATAPEIAGLRLDDPEKPLYAYRQNSSFNNGAEVASFTWDQAGLVATFTLNAPVKSDRAEEAAYAFVLVQRGAQGILDPEGNRVGMNDQGEFAPVADGDLIYNAVREASVNLTEGFDDAEERWADTHLSYTTFKVEKDQETPTVTEVQARRNFLDDTGVALDRVEITFSEPMVAYPRIASPGTLRLSSYAIATAVSEAELASHDMKGGQGADAISSTAVAADVRSALDAGRDIFINAPDANAGKFRVAISVRDPRIVVLDLPGGSLPLGDDFIKVSAGTTLDSRFVADPAGNRLAGSDRERVGSIF